MTTPMRVGIIGAGAAGLAAAYELTRQGHYAEVFEAAPFLDGRLGRVDIFTRHPNTFNPSFRRKPESIAFTATDIPII